MDAARTALRLGAETHIVYRRSEEELPARAEEVHHAKEEGIIFDLLTNPTEILTDDKGNVTGMKCIKMELGEPDASGRRKPVEIPGSEFVMELDAVIMSLGTSPNPLISSTTKGLDINKRKCIVAEEETGKTSKEACICRWRCCYRCSYSYSCHGSEERLELRELMNSFLTTNQNIVNPLCLLITQRVLLIIRIN